MKVDRSKLKKSSSEVPADCKVIIDKLKALSDEDLYKEVKEIKVWTYGKCELYHWADILDMFDSILERSCTKEAPEKWTLFCDLPGSEQLKKLLLEILRFTALLIEHSFSRHLYNSMDHLTTLLTSCDMGTVLYVLNLLYVFSKRSNFISRMNLEKKQGLIQRLIHLAESWGGKENGFGLAECCQDLPQGSFPTSATTLHFEFYSESKDDKNKKASVGSSNVIQSIHMENIDKAGIMPSHVMEDILELYDVPQEKQVLLFTHIRLACLFSNYQARVHCVQARLQAISILVYSSAIQDSMNVILYPGLIEELVDIVEIKDPALVDIKSAALRTLTSVIHIERNPRLNSIIDATGASSYHGFLPVLVRTCIQHMIDEDLKPFPQTYATSLFSFLYHLASYENGVEALVSCGMMESLLKVINWYGDGQEHITFVTRAVRVIELITNMDMAAFQAHGGLQAFINRLEHEVGICRREQPFMIRLQGRESSVDAMPDSPLVTPMEVTSDQLQSSVEGTSAGAGVEGTPMEASAQSTAGSSKSNVLIVEDTADGNNKKNKHCFAQRAALLKSMLNFMKKAIPEMSFADSIRHLMDGSLPKSLKHIISNAEYYGPSLFLLATDVVTVYVFQEPSLLSSLQDKGLTDIVLHALLIKDVPATREILASLPNVFSALCLNARGLEAFVACKPFDRLFKVLLSPDYLPAMRRRRSSDPFGDTASNLGNAMDELMRHQPSLRTDATKAIIKLLEEICSMGQDPHYICQKQQPKNDQPAAQSSVRSPQSNEASSSDEEDEEEVDMPHMPPSITASTHLATTQSRPSSSQESMQTQERQAIPLMDYVLNVMKFVEAILSNNSTDDHCREFVHQKGLKPLMSILGLPNLPIDFPSSPACQAVSSVCKSILTLSREPQVMKQGLLQMNEVLQQLEPLHQPLEAPGGSVLLHELANCAHLPEATLSPSATPLLHALAAAHAYIMMFVHVCRMGQTDIRTISVSHWGSDLGLEVLKGLSSLYNSLVWESTVLLALCNEDYLPAHCQFGRADLEKLLSKDAREKGESAEGETVADTKQAGSDGGKQGVATGVNPQEGIARGSGETGSNGVSVAMETLTTGGEEGMDTSESGPVPQFTQPVAAGASPSSSVPVGSSAQFQGEAGSAENAGQSLNVPPAVSASLSSSSIESENLPGPGGSGAAGVEEKDGKKKVSPAMQAQLRQLKPLLTLSSRLGRALSELFVLLVKLCVGSPVRQRRSQQPPATPPVPSPAAQAVALALTKLLAGGMSFQPPACSPQPKLRMTFLVCSAGFTAPMLFDEKKQPYHLMLQKFVACGGQAALFQSFSWALSMDGKVPLSEGLEHPNLPDGSGEFLDSWLSLVEKMICSKAVLESPHTLPVKGKAPGLAPFNPVQYLISTQKAAFNAVMNLWNKKPLPGHGSRMSESVLTILCHIICGEAVIKKQLEKSAAAAAASGSGDTAVDLSGAGPSGLNTGGSGTSSSGAGAGGASTTSRRPLEPVVNQAHLQQLMDMGFSREQATMALSNTTSLEQATDYILTNPIPAAPAGLTGLMDIDMNDDDQMMRAIAMSLGENAVLSTDQVAKSDGKQEKAEEETEEKQEAEEPLDSAVLDEFTLNIVPGCMNLLDTLPETVYRVCDLLIVVMHRNGPDWKRDTLTGICQDLCDLCQEMTGYAKKVDHQSMLQSPGAKKFASRLHLFSLLAEELNLACALAMHQLNLPGKMVNLLQASRDPLMGATNTSDPKKTPKWLAPMLLLLDLWEKVSVSLKRKIEARIAIGGNRIWKWFDDSSGRWCKYSTNNNTTIDDAYRKGDTFVRFQAGRRKYSVQFGTMVQLNEETGNRRPVMLSIPTAEEKPAWKKDSVKDQGADKQMIEEIKQEFQVPENMDDYLPGLSHDSIETVISCLSAYLTIPLDSDSLHAAMRLILRVTRQHQYAVKFVSEGGARHLLTLTLESSFQGFLNLASLIFRHILEEPVSLRYCMEKVMRNVCAGIGSCQSGVSQSGVGAKEMHYVMRVLGPAAARDPELFTQVARDTLQIVLPPAALGEEDEAKFMGPTAPQILKCTPTKQLESLVNPWIKTFIWDLLNALIMKENASTQTKGRQSDHSQKDGPISMAETGSEGGANNSGPSGNFSWVLPNAGTVGGASQTNVRAESAVVEKDAAEKAGEESTGSNNNTTAIRPLIPKSAILRLLSEIIGSYGNCVQLITQYQYQPGQTDLVPEGCSVLAFILDSLLPSSQTVGDKDCPALSRVFIASIASCTHSPDAQMALVTEVKAALARALTRPEGSFKHHRIQALAGIINTMIESCPSQQSMPPNQVFKGQHVVNNNMMKILVKKGMLVDLARIPHSLDLSSPFLASTINAVLKPLEILSRSVNSPDKFVSMKKSGDQGAGATEDQGGTTTQVVTEPSPAIAGENLSEAVVVAPSEMNVTIEDVTNSLEAQEDLEVSTDQRVSEPQARGQEEELNHVLQILRTGATGNDGEDQVISDTTISQEPTIAEEDNDILIDVEVEGDEEEYEPHDSQMVSQVLSDDEDEGDDGDNDRDHDDNQDDVSGDEEDYDEGDQEEMGEDDDDEEDDEDDEDDEASDIENDGDDYQEMRNPFDTEMVLMEDLTARGGHHIVFNDTSQMPYHLPMHLHDNEPAQDRVSMPPAPSNITSTHPLLMRSFDLQVGRGHRSARQRMRTLPAFHVNLNSATRQANTPVILQRLLGQSTAAEILQLTSTLSSQGAGGGGATHMLLGDENLPMIPRLQDQDEVFEELFSEAYADSSSSGTGALYCIPATLTRWCEETKVLDGDGVYDLVMVIKPPIVEELVRKRDEEMAERKEKRKKNAETSLTDDKKKEKSESGETKQSEAAPREILTTLTSACNDAQLPSSTQGGQSTQAAEMLASAMVEQVLSPMIPTSPESPVRTTVSATGTSSSTVTVTSTTLAATPSPQVSSTPLTTVAAVTSVPAAESLLSQFLAEASGNSQLGTTASGQSQLQPLLSVPLLMSPFVTATTTTATSSTLTSLASATFPPFPPPPSFLAPARSICDGQVAEESAEAGSAERQDISNQTSRSVNSSATISQLLDSFIEPTLVHGGTVVSSGMTTPAHPLYTPAITPFTGSSGLMPQLPTPMPIRHLSYVPPSDFNVSPPHFFLNSPMEPLTSTTAPGTTPGSAGVQSATTTGTTPSLVPLSVATTPSLSSTMFQLPNFDEVALSTAPPASSTDGQLDNVDLSDLFSHTPQLYYGSSGATGATPPLSNLSFVTTTAPASTSITTAEPTTSAAGGSAASSGRGSEATDPEIPEGVDPSFLAALPEHIRQEVISEQLRLQRIRRRAQEQAQQSAATTSGSGESNTAMDVNPEFLAALPPAIQEEVLAQQRAEQARMAAQQQGTTNPDMPVDPATFFSTLPATLRQQVLSDMDDSMLAVLPPELAAEAQELRRDMEERHRRLLQERLFAQAGAASISAILRQSGLAGRLGPRYAIRATQRHNSQWAFGRIQAGNSGSANLTKVKGRFMLDPEALTCLLVLLFIDEPKLNTSRLHRVLRNLCYHGPTRAWLIRALLSIVQRAGENSPIIANVTSNLCVEERVGGAAASNVKDKGKGKKSLCSQPTSSSSSFSSSVTCDGSSSMQSDCSQGSGSQPSAAARVGTMGSSSGGSSGGFWLSISLEAALGCRANVFQIQRASGKKSSSSSAASVTIHPQASPVVCRHALDTLISLAKIFPTHFLPVGKVKEVKCEGLKDEEDLTARKPPAPVSSGQAGSAVTPCLAAGQSSPKSSRHGDTPVSSSDRRPDNDFWNILVRLDNASGKSKGKGVQRSHSTIASEAELMATDYTGSALGQLMAMLAHPVVRRSQLLTDRLLRLLGLVSVNLPDNTTPPTSTQARTRHSSASVRPSTTMSWAVSTTTTTAVTASTPTVVAPTSQDGAEVVAAPTASQQEGGASTQEKTEEAKEPEEQEDSENNVPILQNELKLSVEVLTSKSCSEEGLEDATNLLLQLSRANSATRSTVLDLLLAGARQLGLTVCGHIQSLLEQLQELNLRLNLDAVEEEGVTLSASSPSGASQSAKGTLQDRFSTGARIVVSAPSKLKTGRELQLPSMSQLTSKTSGQQFFLRILKVIIQLRDAARSAGAKNKRARVRAVIDSIISESLEHNAHEVLESYGGYAQSNTEDNRPGEADETGGVETPMEVDTQSLSTGSSEKETSQSSAVSKSSSPPPLPRLSEQLGLDELWSTLGDCLAELARTPDHHAVLILQPAVEAFFIVHAGEKGSKPSEQPVTRREDQLAHLNMEMAPPSPSPGPSSSQEGGALSMVTRENSGIGVTSFNHLPPDTQKFLKFAETHRMVLNQILRQSTLPLAEGPFSVLVDHTRILDFDVKRRYFRQELERLNEGARREDLPVHVRRSNVFEDSFRELFRRSPEEWKQRFYIVFEGEEGQDAGGLLREWYIIISHEIFNQNYALFLTSPGDRVTYTINPSSHCNSNHLSYFKFVGRIMGKAVYDNKLLDCYFTRSFYKHMLGLAVKYTDMESEDYAFYQGLVFLLENNVADLGYDVVFSTEIQEFGVTETRELRPGGANELVTEENKREYVKLVCQMKMTGAIRQQLNAFLEGFYDIIPKKLVSIFTEQELELLISGLPTIDIDDLKANTEYHKYQATSLQIQWFWRALRSFDQAERANFLQFVTGTSKVPLGGFANLEGMNGTQKFQIHRDDRSTDRLPSAHTCFNQLDLPAYETYDKLRKMLLLAISECSEGFGLA